jgi:hypothetical protein
MDKFRQGHWACRAELPPTAREMKSHFTFYHILLLRSEAGNKPMIPADGIMHAPVIAMFNPLIWFLEGAMDEGQFETPRWYLQHPG